jgi:hypothetical protein
MTSPTDAVGASHRPWSAASGEPGPAGRTGPDEPELVTGAARPGALPGEETPGGTGAAAARSWAAAGGREPLAELAERVAERVMNCPDVLRLTAGPRGWIVTYRAGPPFAGVAVHDAVIEVGVVVRYGRPFAGIAEDVRRLVRPLAGRRTVDVLIGDVTDDG